MVTMSQSAANSRGSHVFINTLTSAQLQSLCEARAQLLQNSESIFHLLLLLLLLFIYVYTVDKLQQGYIVKRTQVMRWHTIRTRTKCPNCRHIMPFTK